MFYSGRPSTEQLGSETVLPKVLLGCFFVLRITPVVRIMVLSLLSQCLDRAKLL